jgi:hypothetical protein
MSELYTIRGRHTEVKQNRIKFKAAGYAPPQLVNEVIRYLPPQANILPGNFNPSIIPSELGGPLIRAMNRFDEEFQEIYRANAVRLDNAHQLLADEFEVKTVYLRDLTMTLLGKLQEDVTEPGFCAIDQSLRRVSSFIFKIGFRLTRDASYVVLSKREARSIDTVVSWVRQYQEASAKSVGEHSLVARTVSKPLVQFIAKARRLIHKSRKLRSATTMGTLGPSSDRYTPDQTDDGLVFKRIPGESFSETDRMVIAFMHRWTGSRTMGDHKHLRAAATVILRAIGYYDDLPLEANIGRLFLQEIGVWSPWENSSLFWGDANLPGHGTSMTFDKMLQENQALVDRLDTLELVDSMRHLRKDWGDLDVFCIDDASAMEIDDAISLEAIPGSEDRFWIHVHVANPSAFLSPDHPFAKFASRMVKTMYLPERSYPMLPSQLTQRYLSLAPDRPVLTFSAMLDRGGEILDHKISPGIIRNVVNLTPRQVDEILGMDTNMYDMPSFIVGGSMPEAPRRQLPLSVTKAQRHTLRTLNELRLARLAVRRKFTEYRDSSLVAGPKIEVSAGRKPMPRSVFNFRQSYHYQGDPIIRLGGSNSAQPEGESGRFVSTIMILAGEVAARWCCERNIPIMYRGSTIHPEAAMAEEVTMAYLKNRPQSLVSSTPVRHVALGTGSYCTCTSPLRRYADLVAHWQIEAALRYENSSGKSLVGLREASCLPLSREEVNREIHRVVPRSLNLTLRERLSEMIWVGQFMFRAFHFKEAPLPDSFQVVVWQSVVISKTLYGKAQFQGIALPWRFQVLILKPQHSDEAEWGIDDLIEAKIVVVDTHSSEICVQGIRVIKKASSVNIPCGETYPRYYANLIQQQISSGESTMNGVSNGERVKALPH